jgi:hypothetical protein
VAGALFYCPKASLQRRVVRVEGTLDGLMYIGRPNHLLYLTQLEYKAIYRRTGKIGLAKFLYARKVPGISSARCVCDRGEETARHMVLYCTKEAERHQFLRTDGRRHYRRLVGTNEGARKLTEWMIRSGRLGQFSLAKKLLYN